MQNSLDVRCIERIGDSPQRPVCQPEFMPSQRPLRRQSDRTLQCRDGLCMTRRPPQRGSQPLPPDRGRRIPPYYLAIPPQSLVQLAIVLQSFAQLEVPLRPPRSILRNRRRQLLDAVWGERTFVEERTVGPSLGQDSIQQGFRSFLVGGVLVVAFMIEYYKGAGLVAVVALVFNGLFLMAILAGFQAVLTLPGIAGIVLTLGMAVDANVLIYARDPEDPLKQGRAREWLRLLWRDGLGRTSTQVLSEFYVIVTRKIAARVAPEDAWQEVQSFLEWDPQRR